jgi:hypothetical protein
VVKRQHLPLHGIRAVCWCWRRRCVAAGADCRSGSRCRRDGPALYPSGGARAGDAATAPGPWWPWATEHPRGARAPVPRPDAWRAGASSTAVSRRPRSDTARAHRGARPRWFPPARGRAGPPGWGVATGRRLQSRPTGGRRDGRCCRGRPPLGGCETGPSPNR